MQPGIDVGGAVGRLPGAANCEEPQAELVRVVEPAVTSRESSSSRPARRLRVSLEQLTRPDPHRTGWAEVVRVAVTDPLTRLPNRALLHDRLSQAIARLAHEPSEVAVLFIDVDRFKLVNGTLGQGAGDDLLVAIADRLSRTLRVTDTLARFGGDEFVVVAEPIAAKSPVIDLGQRLVEAVAQPLEIARHTIAPSISVGIAIASRPHGEPAELIQRAAMAMSEAKDAGGGRCRLDEPRSHPARARRGGILRPCEPWSATG